MRTHLITAVAALLTATTANATVVDFETATSGPTIVQPGVTITAGGEFISVTNTPNGTLGLLAGGSPRNELVATFSALTNTVSVDLGDFNGDADTLFLEAFGISDNLLGSVTLLTDSSDFVMHTLSLNVAGISYARFGARSPSVGGSSVFADNLTFASTAAVPEPAAWAMMLLGFGGIGIAVRKQRKSLFQIA
jgi:hypothetical protein